MLELEISDLQKYGLKKQLAVLKGCNKSKEENGRNEWWHQWEWFGIEKYWEKLLQYPKQ